MPYFELDVETLQRTLRDPRVMEEWKVSRAEGWSLAPFGKGLPPTEQLDQLVWLAYSGEAHTWWCLKVADGSEWAIDVDPIYADDFEETSIVQTRLAGESVPTLISRPEDVTDIVQRRDGEEGFEFIERLLCHVVETANCGSPRIVEG